MDLANFLQLHGGQHHGVSTDVIKIRGVKQLRGGAYSIIPDQIEAGTYMAAVAAAGVMYSFRTSSPSIWTASPPSWWRWGWMWEELDDAVRVRRSGPISRTNVKTMPYPGFPTDMQPQIAAVLCLATGTSVLTEGVWDSRYRYVDEFRRMGAHIQVDGKVAVIEGFPASPARRSTPVTCVRARPWSSQAWPPRASLRWTGSTTSSGAMRDLVGKLVGVGADIQVVTVPDEESQSQAV